MKMLEAEENLYDILKVMLTRQPKNLDILQTNTK